MKSFCSKKGEMTTSEIVKIVFVIFLIFIIIYGLYYYGSDIKSTLDFLPSFNMSKDKTVDFQKLKYSITNADVKYYDGNNWLAFPEKAGSKEMKLGDKLIVYGDAYRGFVRFYYDANRKKGSFDLQTKNGMQKILINKVENNIVSYPAGNGLFSKKYIFQNYIILNDGLYLVNYDGSIYQRVSSSSSPLEAAYISQQGISKVFLIDIHVKSEAYLKSSSEIKKHLNNLNGKKIIYSENTPQQTIKIDEDYSLNFVESELVYSGSLFSSEKVYRDHYSLSYKGELMIKQNTLDIFFTRSDKTQQIGSGKIMSNYREFETVYSLMSKTDSAQSQILAGVQKWFDDGLSKPAMFNYYDSIDNEKRSLKQGFFCIERHGNDLIGDLSKPVSEGAVCSNEA